MSDSMHIVCPHCQSINRVPANKLAEKPNCGRCQHPLFTGKPIDLTTATFARHLERSDLPLLVDFWAPWCGPCRMIAPVLETLSRELAGRIKVVKVNVDESPRTAQRYKAQSIPMLLLMDRGEVVDTIIGAQPAPILRSRINGALERRA